MSQSINFYVARNLVLLVVIKAISPMAVLDLRSDTANDANDDNKFEIICHQQILSARSEIFKLFMKSTDKAVKTLSL